MLPSELDELDKLGHGELMALCERLGVRLPPEPSRDLLVALLALRREYGPAGKLFAVEQVRSWVSSVDIVLQQVGALTPEDISLMDLLDHRLQRLSRKRPRQAQHAAHQQHQHQQHQLMPLQPLLGPGNSMLQALPEHNVFDTVVPSSKRRNMSLLRFL